MPKFSVTAAFSVQCYLDVEIEAPDLQHALQELKRRDQDLSLWENWNPEYDTADEHRIVEISDENGEIVEGELYTDSDEWAKI